MKVSVVAQSAREVPADLLALPVFQLPEKGWKLPTGAAALDRALSGALGAAIAAGDFRGKRGQTHLAYGGGKVSARRVLLAVAQLIAVEPPRRPQFLRLGEPGRLRQRTRDRRRQHRVLPFLIGNERT